MSRVLIVELGAPPRDVSPNRSVHWGDKHVAKKGAGEAAFWRGHQAMVSQFGERVRFTAADLQIEWRVGGGRRNLAQVARPKDEDNAMACLKAVIDAFKHIRHYEKGQPVHGLGLLPEDDARHLSLGTPRLVPGDDMIVLTFTEREPKPL